MPRSQGLQVPTSTASSTYSYLPVLYVAFCSKFHLKQGYHHLRKVQVSLKDKRIMGSCPWRHQALRVHVLALGLL